MKKGLLLLTLLLSPFFLTACKTAQAPGPDADTITSFEECVAAGNPVMESYPRQCRHNGQTFTEIINEPIGGDEKPCTREFRPVCGEVQVQCIKAPCPPIKTTFNNRCLAENEGAESITEGACEDENPDPEGACLAADNKWIPETSECEGMSREQCENLGGTFNECASACRNDPNAEICTMQCVLVCQF